MRAVKRQIGGNDVCGLAQRGRALEAGGNALAAKGAGARGGSANSVVVVVGGG